MVYLKNLFKKSRYIFSKFVIIMKKSFLKITSLLLAFVVVFSTFSFTYSEHYCGDSLVDSALFSKADSCGMEDLSNFTNENANILQKNCCSTIVKQFNGLDNLDVVYPQFNPIQQLFFVSFVYSYLQLFSTIEKQKIAFQHYSPPLIQKNIQVLFQVFRI